MWDVSRVQYIDHRTHGSLPIMMATITLAEETTAETTAADLRLTKTVDRFHL